MNGWKPAARCPKCGRPPNVRYPKDQVRRARRERQRTRVTNVVCSRCRTRYWIRAGEIARAVPDINGKLSPKFPGYHPLREAGIRTLADLAEVEDLQAIDGIGPAIEREIRAALAESRVSA